MTSFLTKFPEADQPNDLPSIFAVIVPNSIGLATSVILEQEMNLPIIATESLSGDRQVIIGESQLGLPGNITAFRLKRRLSPSALILVKPNIGFGRAAIREFIERNS